MRISDLVDARVGLLGFGLEGRATLGALRRAGHTGEITLFVDKPDGLAHEEPGAGARFASDPEPALAELDVLIRSPGFAPHHALRRAADRSGVHQTTAMNLFFRELRHAGLPSVGVTGSKGKSTTSTLIFRALERSGVSTALVGNIGSPALDALDGVLRQRSTAVVELSSYHCADLEIAPSIAVLLQLFPEHMDWHGSIDAYYDAKLRIALQQQRGDRFYYLAANAEVVGRLALSGEVEAVGTPEGVHWADGAFWRGADHLFSDECVKIPGQHNKSNIAAVIAAATAVGASLRGLQDALGGFSGLEFRLQDEGEHAGIRWINDSISTAPEATAAALGAFSGPTRTLIVGGFDRGYDLSPIVAALRDSAVERVIALPATGHRLSRELTNGGVTVPVLEVPDLASAVRAAADVTPRGAVCLFSPGAPSYGFFRDFEDRGRQFAKLLWALDGASKRPAL
jgi:UDP-N-acetylmuramoylalanine--D-glutamate ligase